MTKPHLACEPRLRRPGAEDGARVWALVRACAPLDENSLYANLLQCSHFRETCVLAEQNGEIVGWVSGYLRPDASDTLFVWQVAVAASARGQGLGLKMLRSLLARAACGDVQRLETTITADNAASWALFERLADTLDAETGRRPHFTRSAHFNGQHATEHLLSLDLSAQDLRRAA